MVASAIIVPILANLAIAFPEGDVSKYIALPSLLMIPSILIAGALSKYISKKYILIAGTCLFFLGGIGGSFVVDYNWILTMRCILGVGCGLVYPMPSSMIAQLFRGGEMVKLMGYSNATGAIFSVILGLSSGFLGVINWRYCFLLEAPFIIIIIMQFVFVPKLPPENKDEAYQQRLRDQGFDKSRVNYKVWIDVFAMFAFMTAAMLFIFKLAIFIVSQGIGDSSNAGIASSMNTLASVVAGILFALFYKKLRRFTSVLALGSMTIAFFLLATAQSFAMVIVATFVFGFAMGITFPFFLTRIPTVCPAAKTMGLSFLSMGIYFGQFMASYYSDLINYFVKDIRMGFVTNGFVFLAFTIIASIFIVLTQNKEDKNICYNIRGNEPEKIAGEH